MTDRDLPRRKSGRDYLESQAAYESNARTYPRKLPVAIDKAAGMRITDVDGRVFLDCLSGAGTLALGHNHPVVVAAMRAHLDAGRPLLTLDLTTPVKDAFVEALFSTLPSPLRDDARIHFCSPSGSDAVEAAIKLVKTATGNRGIVAFAGGYHGHTHGALAIMGNRGPKASVPGLMGDAHFLPYSYCYRCPTGRDDCRNGAPVGAIPSCVHFAENQFADPENGLPPLAGLILEPVQGEGGVIPADDRWMRAVARLARERDAALILDEVQTGWGRTGTLYAFERTAVVPDVLVLSKAIGGGLPLAVIVYRGELDLWKPGAHAGTFRGNQLAMAAGLATLRFMQETDVPGNAAAMGARFMDRLLPLKDKHPFVGDLRGRGLMIGMEIVAPDRSDGVGRPAGDGERARALQAACFRRGLIVELGGRHGAVMRLLPPLTITADEVDSVASIIGSACADVAVTADV